MPHRELEAKVKAVLARYDRVKVWWWDPHDLCDTWTDDDEVSAQEPTLCYSEGWLVFEDEFRISVASAFNADGGFGSGDTIPKGCVKSLHREPEDE